MEYLRDKLAATSRVFDRVLEEFRRPAVMWSSGKDSQVLLYLLRARRMDLDVIFHREPFLAEKYEFAERMQREWNLRCYDWAPSEVSVQKAGGVLEIVNHHRFGKGLLSVPKNLYEPKETRNKKWLCGLKDLLNRPMGDIAYRWDCVLVGHKSSDRDPFWGGVPLNCDVQMNVGAPALAFPLRDWTDEDVWAYTRAYDVPQQEDRYNRETGEENPDKGTNPDYWACCTRCIDRDGPASVYCPKLKLEVGNVSKQVNYREAERPSYMNAECGVRSAELKKGVEHAV